MPVHTVLPTSRFCLAGNFVKIRVSQTGVYKLTYSELQNMGLKPEAVRVYGHGGAMMVQSFLQSHIDDLPAVPFYMYKGADGVFNKGDYILFYAQAAVSWQYTGIRFSHTQNPYSDYGYYFLSDNAGKQILLDRNEAAIDTVGCAHVTTFVDYQLHERDSLNLVDLTGSAGGGKEWYGETFSNGTTLKVPYTFSNIVPGKQMYCYIAVAATSSTESFFTYGIGENTNKLRVAQKPGEAYAMASTSSGGYRIAAGDNDKQTLTLSYASEANGAIGYLNYIELAADRYLKMTGGVLYVRNTEYYKKSVQTVFHVTGAKQETQVWNVTKRDSICSVPAHYADGELIFKADNDVVQEFVVITPSEYAGLKISPVSKSADYKKVPEQNLHGLHDIDMVILTHELFLEPSRRLAEEHKRKDGYTVAIVTDEQVYNEFSSGTPDATAYRMFMKMLYDRALDSEGSEHAPRFLLLVGDGSYDNRKRTLASATPVLLTYQANNSVNEVEAYSSDDYFGFLKDASGTRESADSSMIAIGRLPVRDLEQANQVIDKIIRYMENPTRGKWKTQTCFLSDDGDHGMHMRSSDTAAQIVRKLDQDVIINKLHLDAYQQETRASGESYPIVKSRLDNLLQNGVMFFDYCGHAGHNNITSEQMLTSREIRQMSNQNQGFWMLATCNFAAFDASITSAAEEAILNPNGGAVGLLAACRTVFAEHNEHLNNYVCEQIVIKDSLGRYVNTIGEAVQKAKHETTARLKGDKNKLCYILLGDPALRLNYADEYVIATSAMADTLKALSVQKIEGFIRTHEGDTATDFNGKVQVSVYDKQQQLVTLDNDETDEKKKSRVKFYDFPNLLFSGEAQVKDGKFDFEFMVPKDIKYNFGNGRITYYAYDTISGAEASGHYEEMIIGGSTDIEVVDTVGPELHLYINNKHFINGGQTNESPHFYADIKDENGINTIGNGIGHDLLLIIDNDAKQTFILNDNFTAKSGSYQEGRVSYKMSEMEEGMHSVMFRAWDLLNNSSTSTLDFEVVKGLTPEIYSLMLYPNPVPSNGVLNVVIDHDRPDAALETDMYIFNMSGHMVYAHSQIGADNIQLSPAAMNLTSGVYFFRVLIKTPDSEYNSKTGKIIVLN